MLPAAPTPIEITPEHTASKENMSDLLASIRDTREKASVEREVQEQSDNQAAVLQKQARQESRQEILAMQDEIKALKDLLSSKDASGNAACTPAAPPPSDKTSQARPNVSSALPRNCAE